MRPTLYDTVYIALDDAPIDSFMVNANTVVRSENTDAGGSVWSDITYPAYDGTLHVTFSHIEDSIQMNDVVKNRSERMALNQGSHTAEQLEIKSPSGKTHTVILTSRTSTLTPVQFITTTPQWVISGAFTINHSSPAETDSLLPMYQAVRNDLIRMALSL